MLTRPDANGAERRLKMTEETKYCHHCHDHHISSTYRVIVKYKKSQNPERPDSTNASDYLRTFEYNYEQELRDKRNELWKDDSVEEFWCEKIESNVAHFVNRKVLKRRYEYIIESWLGDD